MAEKKYHWLKMSKGFLKRHDCKMIKRRLGFEGLIYYISLLLESIDHDGHLRFSKLTPYDVETLAEAIDADYDEFKKLYKLLIGKNLMLCLEDGTFYLPYVTDNTGREGQSAERVRRYREKINALQCNGDVTECNNDVTSMKRKALQCNTEKELEKDKDKDKDKDLKRNTCPFQDVQALFLKICTSLPKIKGITDKRKKVLRIWWQKGMTLEKFERFFKLVEASDFLTGRVKDFTASFDWIIKPENRQKIIEGNYDNKETVKTGSITDTIDFEAIYRKKEEEERIMNNASNTIKGGN